jgi:hypothetical protein
MPSGAVRLPGAAAVTAAGAGVVTAEPSWMAERRRRGNPSGVGPAQRRWPWPWPWPSRMSGRRPRHWSPVRVRCPPGDVCPLGRADVRCPRDRCPRDRRDPGVRTDTPPVTVARRPRCPHRAGSWHASVRWGRPRLGASGAICCGGRRVAGSSLPRIGVWQGRDGRGFGCAWLRQGRRQTGRRYGSAAAAASRSPPGRHGSCPAQGAGRLVGARARAAAHTSPCRCVLDQLPV